MIFELTMTNLIVLVVSYFGSLFGLLKYINLQQEKRLGEKFEALSQSIAGLGSELRREADATRQLETAFLRFQAELPRDYVRRDDFLRSIGQLETRIDNFAMRMERALAPKILGGGQ